MENNDQVKLFKQALEGIEKLEIKYPGYPPFVSIHNQLQYLIDMVNDKNDGSQISKINMGLLIAREVETRDEALAEVLYSVNSELKQMNNSKK
jgi:hypothetical protein